MLSRARYAAVKTKGWPVTAQPEATSPAAVCDGEQPRRRNAAQTREALLKVAKSRFARYGYATTTVREIADDAGVNVALINRYFTSKEGLFEACLETAMTEMDQETTAVSLDEVATKIGHRIAGPDDSRTHEALLMLIRSSGDERTEELRRAILRSFSVRLAASVGGQSDPARLLRAQVILSAALGMTLMRSLVGVEPIASAGEEEISGALSDMIRALLPADGDASRPAPGAATS